MIKPKDEAKIVKDLAQGKSYREARKGTDVKSLRTITNISRRNIDKIARLKKKFLKEVEKSGGSLKERAEVMGEMVQATKSTKHGQEPDWKARANAIVYLNRLDGFGDDSKGEPPQYNQFNFFSVPERRAKELKEKFSRVLKGEI